jgi:hypothetical protein
MVCFLPQFVMFSLYLSNATLTSAGEPGDSAGLAVHPAAGLACQNVQSDSAAEHPREELLVIHALRQPDAVHVADPAALSADGSTTIYFAPTRPSGVGEGNWIQTMPGKGRFLLFRLYGPLEPFFTKEWRPSEIALVN